MLNIPSAESIMGEREKTKIAMAEQEETKRQESIKRFRREVKAAIIRNLPLYLMDEIEKYKNSEVDTIHVDLSLALVETKKRHGISKEYLDECYWRILRGQFQDDILRWLFPVATQFKELGYRVFYATYGDYITTYAVILSPDSSIPKNWETEIEHKLLPVVGDKEAKYIWESCRNKVINNNEYSVINRSGRIYLNGLLIDPKTPLWDWIKKYEPEEVKEVNTDDR